MGQIRVEGLGTVQIQGDAPTEAEERAIVAALRERSASPAQAPSQPRGAPQPAQAPQERPSEPFFTEREFNIGLGGMTGAAVGAPLGPAGMVAGGALGSAIGSLGTEVAQDAASRAGVLGEERRLQPGAPQRALREGALDAVFSAGAGAAGAVAGMAKGAGARALGFGQEALERAQRANLLFGTKLGRVDASTSQGVRGIPRVIGRFPFVGTPFKEAKGRMAGELESGFERMMFRLGPSATAVESGIDLTQAAKRSFKWFRDGMNEIYGTVKELADSKGPIIPVENIRSQALDALNEASKGQIFRTVNGRRVPVENMTDNPIIRFADQLSTMEGPITATQLDNLMKQLDTAMSQARRDGFEVVNGLQLKKSAESALRQTPDEELREAVEIADHLFTTGMRTFETPTAQRFGRVNKNVFRVGFDEAGTLNADELFKVAFNAKSPTGMNDLRRLVGEDAFRQAVRTHVEDAFSIARNAAPEGQLFDLKSFRNALGISNKRSPTYQAMREALSETEVPMDLLEQFLKVSEDVFAIPIQDVSTFVARRATLGGAGSVIRALGGPVGAAAAAGTGATVPPVGITIAGLLGTRGMSQVLANPTALRLMSAAGKAGPGTPQGKAAIVRALRLVAQEDPVARERLAETGIVDPQGESMSRGAAVSRAGSTAQPRQSP